MKGIRAFADDGVQSNYDDGLSFDWMWSCRIEQELAKLKDEKLLFDLVSSDNDMKRSMFKVLAERKIVKTVYASNSERKRQRQLWLLHELMPSHYSEMALRGQEDTFLPQPPQPDEPFGFVSDDNDYEEITVKARNNGFDDEITGVCHDTEYGRMEKPTMDDFLNTMEKLPSILELSVESDNDTPTLKDLIQSFRLWSWANEEFKQFQLFRQLQQF